MFDCGFFFMLFGAKSVLSCKNRQLETNHHHKIVVVGTGKLASVMGSALYAHGFVINQVTGRNVEKARRLAIAWQAEFISSLHEISHDTDLVLLAVSDDALHDIVAALPSIKGICAHTSGSVGLDIFKQYPCKSGVFYPLQTFSEKREINLSETPFLIEGCCEKSTDELKKIASVISKYVYHCNSAERKNAHLAAVFVSNFVNALLGMGENILEGNSLPFSVLRPLVIETVSKAFDLGAVVSQTGPAVRGDEKTLNSHLEMLSEKENLSLIYKHLTDFIRQTIKQIP